MFGKSKSAILSDAERLEHYIAAYMKATGGKIPSDELISKFLQGEVRIPIKKKSSTFAKFMRWYLSENEDVPSLVFFMFFFSIIVAVFTIGTTLDNGGGTSLILARLSYILLGDFIILAIVTAVKLMYFTYVVNDSNKKYSEDDF